jgi:hypothetical protein
MHKDIIFKFSSNTFEGYPVIGAGICDIAKREEVLNAFSRIDKIALGVDSESKPFSIDQALKEKIAAISPDYISGLALSIKVPGASGPTGGIIGNPVLKGTSADGTIECIGSGYCVASLPGGPGLMIKGRESIAKNIFTNIVLGENKLIAYYRITEEFERNNIDIAIIIKDGTGAEANGMIMTYYYGTAEFLWT